MFELFEPQNTISAVKHSADSVVEMFFKSVTGTRETSEDRGG